MKERVFLSCDAKPIDFSYKEIKFIEEIRGILPRQGLRK